MSGCQEKWLHCILLLARPHVYIGSCMCLTWKANSCDQEHYVKPIITFSTAAAAASVVTATASAAATGTGNGTDADVPTTTTTITTTTSSSNSSSGGVIWSKCWLWCFTLHNFLLHVFFSSFVQWFRMNSTCWPNDRESSQNTVDIVIFRGSYWEVGSESVYMLIPLCA